MLLTRTSLFVPLDLKRRVFTKVSDGRRRAAECPPPDVDRRAAERRTRRSARRPSSCCPVAQLVRRPQRASLVRVNERAPALFGLGRADLGRPLQDLELSYRPVELRSAIDEAVRRRGRADRRGVRVDRTRATSRASSTSR